MFENFKFFPNLLFSLSNSPPTHTMIKKTFPLSKIYFPSFQWLYQSSIVAFNHLSSSSSCPPFPSSPWLHPSLPLLSKTLSKIPFPSFPWLPSCLPLLFNTLYSSPKPSIATLFHMSSFPILSVIPLPSSPWLWETRFVNLSSLFH